MKPASFILPGLVIVSGIAWLSTQAVSISKQKAENSQLLDQIHRASRMGVQTSSADLSAPDRESTASRKKHAALDWKRVAEDFIAIQHSDSGDGRPLLRLQQQINKLSAEEIAAALDEIATLDIPKSAKAGLEQLLFGPLVQKSPQLALDRYFVAADQSKREEKGWQLANALNAWAAKDPAAATAWFEKQITDGVFESKQLDGKSPLRQQFEGAFIAALLSSDPEAASQRLADFPPDQRREMLSHYQLNTVKEKDQAAYADLIRRQLPEEQQAELISRPAAHLANQGYAQAGAYLDRISATPTERATAVMKVVENRIGNLSRIGKIGTAEIDEMRTWTESQSPGSANKATGLAIAETISSADSKKRSTAYDEAVKLVTHYHDQTGSDEILTGFLGSWSAEMNKETSRSLAEKIQDPKQREKMLSRLK